MTRITLLLAMLLVIGVLISFTSQPASAQEQPSARAGEYADVSGVVPFSAAANFMSVPGFLRWQTFRDQGIWISYAEARRIVVAQGGHLYRRA